MNPEPLVRERIAARQLVELVPQRPVDLPLYWQSVRLALPLLQRLTTAVRAAAARQLH
jgi:LysR family transcriptional regulator, chromosome initiation inhibitor